MPAMKRIYCIALAAAFVALEASAAQWSAIRNNDAAKLSIDATSVSRKGDQVSLKYMIDYTKPQVDPLRQLSYRSIVTAATVRCKPRTVSLGTSELYNGPEARGVLVASAVPTRRERAFAAIEKGTSDEDLWRHVCEAKAPAGKP